MHADKRRRKAGKFFDVGAQRGGAQSAIESREKRLGVGDRVPERGAGLPRKGPAARVGDGAGYHQGQLPGTLLEGAPDAEQRRLGVQGVEHRLDHQQVDAGGYEGRGGFDVRLFQIAEADIAKSRIFDIGRDAGRSVGRTEDAGNESRPLRCRVRVGGATRDLRGRQVHVVDRVLEAIVRLRYARRGERIGFYDIGAGVEVGVVNVLDRVRPGERQHIAVALKLRAMGLESLATEVRFAQFQRLLHGAGGAVEDQDALFERLCQGMFHCFSA